LRQQLAFLGLSARLQQLRHHRNVVESATVRHFAGEPLRHGRCVDAWDAKRLSIPENKETGILLVLGRGNLSCVSFFYYLSYQGNHCATVVASTAETPSASAYLKKGNGDLVSIGAS